MTLKDLRAKIDDYDEQIVKLLAQRAECVREVGELKNSDEEIIAEDRQEQVIKTRRAWARQHNLNPDFIKSLYHSIIAYFIEQERLQLERRKQGNSDE